MPRLRSAAKTASPSSSSSSAAAAAPSRTPAPSPSTSVSLGISAAADADGSLKSPGVAQPRRSLRLAGPTGAASPATPTSGPSGLDGAPSAYGVGSGGRRRGRPRAVPAPAVASPNGGELGSDVGGGGGEVRVLGNGGGGGGNRSGEPVSMSLRSGLRVAKRPMDWDVQMSGEVGLGSDGGVRVGDQVYDEMPHRDEESAKRGKSILVGESEVEYVTDSGSDEDDDGVLLAEDGWKMPVQLSTPTNVIEPNVVPMSMEMTDDGGRDGPVEIGKEEIGEVSVSKNYFPGADSVVEAVGGIIKPLTSAGSPAIREIYGEMYLKEELTRQQSVKDGKGKEKLVLGNNDSGAGSGMRTHAVSPDSKGKAKMVVEDSSLSLSSSEDDMDLDPDFAAEVQSIRRTADASAVPVRRQSARERAIALAPKFAFFKADEHGHSGDDDEEEEELEPVADPQDWPGPFSTAMRIMDERDAKLRARELNPSKMDRTVNKDISWAPSKHRKAPLRSAPSLASLCLQTLSNHAEGIESLAGIPDELKHKLLTSLCHSRKMNPHLLNELLCDNPVILQLSECSWLSEDDFEKIFSKCRTDLLQVLQLDISGRCMPDYMLPVTLAKIPNCMPFLRKISLMGNYRISDIGLDTIISAAPSLSSLNLCECSLLTSTGIENLANKLHLVLRELYIDDCLNVDAMIILPALQKIQHLEVLSMSGIQSVCDKFVNELIPVHGSSMRELAFAGCLKLTSSSIKTIGGNCPQLSALDLRNLNRLRNSALRHLRNGCRLMRKLKLQRNTFSDEAVSQFLEESGGSLTNLCLNNVEKVGNLTACAIARTCSVRLEVLDLSFCRELTNEALGLIVDSCSSLRMLKLFGCTQITDVFLKGHSNSLVKIIGIEGSILAQMDGC